MKSILVILNLKELVSNKKYSPVLKDGLHTLSQRPPAKIIQLYQKPDLQRKQAKVIPIY